MSQSVLRHRPSRRFVNLVRLCVVLVLVAFAAQAVGASVHGASVRSAAPPLSFGRSETIAVGDEGFEPDLQINSHDQMFSSVPNGFGTTISFVWRSFDHGKSWHLIPASSPYGTGKPFTCVGGGDTELAIDSMNRLYFSDLQALTNFSASRSANNGASFSTSCLSVLASGVDRQWYAIDGDPLKGGHVFLTYDAVGQGDTSCPGNNELVIAESPPALSALPASQTAGLHFGPNYRITCNEGIMGPDAVSPRVDPKYHKHYVFVIHDSSNLDQVRIARCVQVPVTADPSGLQCSDRAVYGQIGKINVGQNFVTQAIDRSGNIYAVWPQTPLKNGNPHGPTTIEMAYSRNNGTTWSRPFQVNKSCAGFKCRAVETNTNVLPWVTAGDDGRIDIAWYGTRTLTTNDKPTGQYGADNLSNADWKVYMAQSLNADTSHPTFSVVTATKNYIHDGSIQTLPNQNGDRTEGDFLNIRTGRHGEANIVYVNSARSDDLGQSMFVRQNAGPSLYAKYSKVPHFRAPTNSVKDTKCTSANDDAVYNANGSSNHLCSTNLDVRGSSVRVERNNHKLLRVTMKVANLRTLAAPSGSGGTVVDWLTAWHQDCTHQPGCPYNGHVWFVYMESDRGAKPTFFSGESRNLCCAFVTYPGTNQIPATTSNGQCIKTHHVNCYVAGRPGKIVIDVPLAKVSTALRNHTLFSVTASTLTLPRPANSDNAACGQPSGCGVPFNVIDSAPAYNAKVKHAVR